MEPTPAPLHRRTALRVLAGGIATLVLAGCKENPFSHRYRFRLTVEVETPEGMRSGSGVIAVWANYNHPGSQHRFWGVHGEAVAVDLPDGKTLFALLKTHAHFEDMAGLSMEALDPTFTDKYDVVGTAERLGGRDTSSAPAVVNRESYPMLVTFADIADPTSVQLVDPDDLAATFGEGIALKRFTVQITDDPVTTGIEKRLGWLEQVGHQRGSLVKNPPKLLKDYTPRELVTPGDFATEIWK